MPGLRCISLLAVAAVISAGCGDAEAPRPFEADLVFVCPVIRRDSFTFTSDELVLASLDGASVADLTRARGSDQSPAWSPDGRRIAFVRYPRYGESDLYVTEIDGATEVALTDDPEEDTHPVWSPDGSGIAFVHAGDICVIDPDNPGPGAFRNLTNSTAAELGPTWSPDGERLAFSCRSGDAYDAPYGLCTVTVTDGQLDTLVAGTLYDSHPAWSPVDDRIAYTCPTPIGLGICLVNGDGSGRIELVSEVPDYPDPALAWSPDGSLLAYVAGSRLWVATPAAGTVRGLTTTFDLAVESLDWSPDGRSLVFAAGHYGLSQVYVQSVTDSTGDSRRAVTPLQAFSPRWRPGR